MADYIARRNFGAAASHAVRLLCAWFAQPLVSLLSISAVAMSLYVALVPGSDAASIGRWNSDHYSHYNASILFWHRGAEIYNTPIRELCGETTVASRAFANRHGLNSQDSCELPERIGLRPLVINWSDLPRPYPPGQVLYSAPEAILYAHTDASVRTINAITIIKHVLVGHLLMGVIFAMLMAGAKDEDCGDWRGLSFVIVPVVYFGIAPFAMMGFYDSIAILFVCLAIRRLQRNQPIAALALLCLAAFLHFRTLWYLPLGLVTLLDLRRSEHRARLTSARGLALVVLSAALLLLSAAALVQVGPFLRQFPHSNPVLLARIATSPSTINFVCFFLVVGSALAWQRQWLLLVLVAWQGVIIGSTIQAQSWHAMFLLPLLLIAKWQKARAATVVALLLLIIGVTRVAFNAPPLPGAFILQILQGHI